MLKNAIFLKIIFRRLWRLCGVWRIYLSWFDLQDVEPVPVIPAVGGGEVVVACARLIRICLKFSSYSKLGSISFENLSFLDWCRAGKLSATASILSEDCLTPTIDEWLMDGDELLSTNFGSVLFVNCYCWVSVWSHCETSPTWCGWSAMILRVMLGFFVSARVLFPDVPRKLATR